MVKTMKINYKNLYKNLKCENCSTGSLDDQSHAVMCAAWEEQRRGLELYKMKDMVEFFHRILKEKGKREM